MTKTSYILGLTGQIASGKSTVSAFLKASGAKILCADAIVHGLQKAGTPQTKALVEAFSPAILSENGHIDRAKLRRMAQQDASVFPLLEKILHPAVQAEIQEKITQFQAEKCPLIVLDVPLLFGSPLEKLCHGVLACLCPKEIRCARALLRKGMTLEAFETLNNRQMPAIALQKKATFILRTDSPLEETENAVKTLVSKLIE